MRSFILTCHSSSWSPILPTRPILPDAGRQAIYARRNPMKVDSIPDLLQKYRGERGERWAGRTTEGHSDKRMSMMIQVVMSMMLAQLG